MTVSPGRSMDRPVQPSENHLLGLVPQAELDALLPHLEPVWLDFREIVYDLDKPIEYVFFPEDCVISIVGVMQNGTAVEVATVGNEGMVGLPVFLGTSQVLGQAFAQVAGASFRIKAEPFLQAAAGGKFREVLQHYTQALFTQVAQAAACNRLHLTEERFARWLLQTHDRVGRDRFQLTQDFLSQMLGVRRATISEIAARMQNAGIIEYSRGQMSIVNRAGLEELSCECYGIIRTEFERLLGKPKGNPRLQQPPKLPDVSEEGKSTATDGQTPADEVENSDEPAGRELRGSSTRQRGT